MISAPNTSNICRRSIDTLSGIKMVIGLPFTPAIAASAMPVLPEDGSMIRCPGFNLPSEIACSIMDLAMRSFTEPNGFWLSSLAMSRTRGFGDRLLTSTTGVLPMRSSTLAFCIISTPGIVDCIGHNSNDVLVTTLSRTELFPFLKSHHQ